MRELTDEERQAIHAAYDSALGADRVTHLIEDAENYAPFHNPKKYISYYRCIRGWVRREADKVNNGPTRPHPAAPLSQFTRGAGSNPPAGRTEAERYAARVTRYQS